MTLRTIFLWTLIVSLAIAAAMGIMAILFPGFGSTQERILVTSLLVGVFSLPALACAIVLGRKHLVLFMWTGIGCTLIALALWLILVWFSFGLWPNPQDWYEVIAKSATPFTIIAALAMQIGLLSLLRLNRKAFAAVRIATIGSSILLGTLICAVVWSDWFDEEWVARAIGVLSILGACGTVVTPVLALIETLQRRGSRESIAARVTIELVCPRCRSRQTLPAGSARCSQCNLRIDIDVEEPRCACGYLLYQLQSDKCPECGRPVTIGL